MARKKQAALGQSSRSESDSPSRSEVSTSVVSDVESLYRAGLPAEVVTRTEAKETRSADPESRVQLTVLRGMALFDLGDAVASIATLERAIEESKQHKASLQFLATFSLFVRATDFQTTQVLLPGLIQLRQLAASVGDAQSLAGLHLAVARLEGLRGHCIDAHRHLEIARRLAENSGRLALRCSVDLVEASLESFTGNLVRSRHLAESCFRLADSEGFLKYKLGSATNL